MLTQTQKDNIKEEILRAGNSLDVFWEKSARFKRQRVMKIIVDKRLPLNKCGYHAIREALLAFLELETTGKCTGKQDKEIIEKLFESGETNEK